LADEAPRPHREQHELIRVVYERMSENYFEKRRIEYRVVFGYFVAASAVAAFLPSLISSRAPLALCCITTFLGLFLFGFTGSAIWWLFLLHRSSRRNLSEIRVLRDQLLLAGMPSLQNLADSRSAPFELRDEGYAFFAAQAVAVASTALTLVLIAFVLWSA
jgi:hypothetical protein